MFKRSNRLVLHVKQYKICRLRTCDIRKCTYILLVDDHDEVPSTNKLFSTKHQANFSYSRNIQIDSRCNEQRTNIPNAVFSGIKTRKKKTTKKIIRSCQLIIAVADRFCYRFINFTRSFFICLKMFFHHSQNVYDTIEENRYISSLATTDNSRQLQLHLAIIYVSQSAVCV